jgi:GNAT superfamily N-acetyltransferase
MQLHPPTLQIRAARPADAERLCACYLASRKTLLPYAPLVHDDADVLRWLSQELLPAEGTTVALESGNVVGMLAVAEREGAVWIEQLYVHPLRFRRGIGSTLLHLALQRAGRHPGHGAAVPVRLYTFEPNRDARRFYEAHGFKAVAFGDGSGNESHCPDVLYERLASAA